MSPLWPNQLFISLSTQSIALVYRAGLTKRILQQRHINLREQAIDWQSSLPQLEAELIRLTLPVNTKMHVTLASDLVRYLTLPPLQTLMNQAEKLAYAKAAYRETYGAVANEWQVRCHDAAPQHHTVAAAIDEALLDALLQTANKHRLLLITVQPYLMCAFNRLNRQIGKSNALIAMVEPSRILLIQLQNGFCQQIRSSKINDNWQDTLHQMLSRELLIGEHEGNEVMVYAPAQKNATVNLSSDWQLKRLGITTQGLSTEPVYAMLEAAL
ncbi:MAG TPA: hypothetical protein DCO68_12425 [Methylophilaceae bacterium]|nr:hypothetical protein [Methylophilaceae bacterium]